MAFFRIYIDEVGTHAMKHVDNPNHRFLSLTGVILDLDYVMHVFKPEMDEIKKEFFQKDPDVPIIFHRKELVNKERPFDSLRNPQIEQEFNDRLLSALEEWQYRVVTVVIDKKAHRDQYQVWHHHPYHYCLSVLLERFILFLRRRNHRGDVMVESRGGREDMKLKESYARLYRRGTDYVGPELWRKHLSSRQLKVKPKSADIAGLQLADLIAHPSRREILLDHSLIVDKRKIFGDKICEILRREKYLRNEQTGRIEGYGKKLLP